MTAHPKYYNMARPYKGKKRKWSKGEKKRSKKVTRVAKRELRGI